MEKNTLKLQFYTGEQVELVYTEFTHDALIETQCAARGKSSCSYKSFGNFQWTNAVKALAVFLLKAKIAGGEDNEELPAVLLGTKGSIAASLDYALGKEPEWLSSIFGVDRRGRLLAKRFIDRINPELRRAGPVVLGLNTQALAHKGIQVFLDEKELGTAEEIEALLEAVLLQWKEKDTKEVRERLVA